MKGRIARVNLSQNQVTIEESPEFYQWLGGRGFGIYELSKDMHRNYDALDPESKIIFASGCFTGTPLPGSSRIEIVSRNAQNDGINYSSGGGDFSPALRSAGIDAIVIEGKAVRPVYLHVKDKNVRIEDAADLWGKTTWETEDLLRGKIKGKIRVATIGPAGENLSRIACVIIDKAHALAWGGNGAILGSKNLKAIVAEYGPHLSNKINDKQAFEKEVRKYNRILLSSVTSARLKIGGTHGTAASGGWSGKAPTAVRNLQDGHWDPEKTKKTTEKEMRKYEVKRTGCYNCPLKCLHYYEIEEKGRKLEGEGMHANSVRGFGSNWDIDNPVDIFEAHTLCNQMGIDVDGASSSIAWAIECFERGLLTEEDTDGLRLGWGRPKENFALLKKIAFADGFGKILGQGVYRASRVIGRGTEKYAMTVKKTGINEQSLRTHKAWALGIAVSSRGSGHVSCSPQTEKRLIDESTGEWLFGAPEAGNPRSYRDKGRLVAYFEIYKAIIDSIGICYFDAGWYELALASTEFYVDLYNAYTGGDMTNEEMWTIGRRIVNLEKMYNVINTDFTKDDDFLPDRIMEVPVSGGLYQGEVLDRKLFEDMLTEYYTSHEWDPATGRPTEKLLKELGIEHLVKQ